MLYNTQFFDAEIDRLGTDSVKWSNTQGYCEESYNPMWVADMDFASPQEVTKALCERAAHPLYGYTAISDRSTQAMLSFMKRRHGISLTKEEQLMLPCVISGLRIAILTFTKPGDELIIQPPVYPPFYSSISSNGRKISPCPLLKDGKGRYTMDFDSIENACRKGAKMMLLCNPHNPVGRCWTKAELQQLIAILDRYGTLLVSDEIHEDFVYEKNAFIPLLTLTEKAIAITSASKTFNLAGLQQAVLFTKNAEWLRSIREQLENYGVVEGNIFALTATEAAYRFGDQWLGALLAYIREGERLFREEITRRLPKAVLSPLEATYLGWLDISAYGFTTEEAMEKCKNTGVRFVAGTEFGQKEGEGFLRVNLACPHSRIIKAAQQLEEALKGK